MGFIGLDIDRNLASVDVSSCSLLLGGQVVDPFLKGNTLDRRVDTHSVLINTMQYELNMTEGRSRLSVRVYDPVTKALALDLLKEVVRESTKHDVSNLLIDARGVPSTKTTVEDYDIAYYRLEELGFKPHVKSAIVVDPDDQTHDFFETCTMNAGYNWRIFSDPDLANQWLDSASPVP